MLAKISALALLFCSAACSGRGGEGANSNIQFDTIMNEPAQVLDTFTEEMPLCFRYYGKGRCSTLVWFDQVDGTYFYNRLSSSVQYSTDTPWGKMTGRSPVSIVGNEICENDPIFGISQTIYNTTNDLPKITGTDTRNTAGLIASVIANKKPKLEELVQSKKPMRLECFSFAYYKMYNDGEHGYSIGHKAVLSDTHQEISTEPYYYQYAWVMDKKLLEKAGYDIKLVPEDSIGSGIYDD